MDIMSTGEFEPRTVDKVERLLDLLDEMERHPALKGKLALHGGTAINLFMLDVPRLSVDIDVSYIGSVSREDMLADRPRVEAGIEAVAQALGYAVEAHPGGHAGRTFLLRYRGDWGVDHVKVDCIYMNRSPILPPIVRETPVRPGAKVRTFVEAELAAGKVKAFFDRVKVRDLYDISNLRSVYGSLEPGEQERAHQLPSTTTRSPHASQSRSRAGSSASLAGLPSSQTSSTPCFAPRPSTRPLRGLWRTQSVS